MTYRERREARAERLREWADKRRERAAGDLAVGAHFRDDYAFNTQPGHFPLRARIIKAEDRAFESLRKADSMASRATEIDRQADGAIYSDDPDAIERLEAKIVELEARREMIKAENGVYRKAHRTELAAQPSAYERDQAMPHQAYELQNLSGNLTRTRQRLVALQSERDHGPALRGLYTKRGGACAGCGKAVAAGVFAFYRKPDLFCSEACVKGATEAAS